ncbi:MAG: hypothetical protein AAF567_04915 [Actinomycetota bacterium]
MSNGHGSDVQEGPDWWQASDGRFYPPELHPDYQPPADPPPPAPSATPAAPAAAAPAAATAAVSSPSASNPNLSLSERLRAAADRVGEEAAAAADATGDEVAAAADDIAGATLAQSSEDLLAEATASTVDTGMDSSDLLDAARSTMDMSTGAPAVSPTVEADDEVRSTVADAAPIASAADLAAPPSPAPSADATTVVEPPSGPEPAGATMMVPAPPSSPPAPSTPPAPAPAAAPPLAQPPAAPPPSAPSSPPPPAVSQPPAAPPPSPAAAPPVAPPPLSAPPSPGTPPAPPAGAAPVLPANADLSNPNAGGEDPARATIAAPSGITFTPPPEPEVPAYAGGPSNPPTAVVTPDVLAAAAGTPGFTQPAEAATTSPASPASPVAGAVAALGGIAAIVGSLLQWGSGSVENAAGIEQATIEVAGSESNGYFTLAGGVILLIMAALFFMGRREQRNWAIGSFVAGGAVVGLAVFSVFDIQDLSSRYAAEWRAFEGSRDGDIITTAASLGLWVALAGGVLGILAAPFADRS